MCGLYFDTLNENPHSAFTLVIMRLIVAHTLKNVNGCVLDSPKVAYFGKSDTMRHQKRRFGATNLT